MNHSINGYPQFSIIGFLLSEIGLGQAARNIAHSLRAVDLPAHLVNVYIEGRSNDREFASQCSSYAPGNINFIVSDLIQAGDFFRESQKIGLGIKNYLYPSWELDRLPYRALEMLNLYDDIIAPSKFIADTFSTFLGRKIETIPMPVKIPEAITSNTIRNGVLSIFSLMDFDSHVARKNPKGVLDAFSAAFPKNYIDVELVLKVRGVNDIGAREILKAYCEKDARIKVIDQTLTRSEMDLLIVNCNVYLSMHRSEGFGFGAAEALANGKIVVSTDYGGTCDFINSNTGYPVDFKMTPVKAGEYPLWEHQLWAEPSVESAAYALMDIYQNYSIALERAKIGRALMIKHHSFEVIGQEMKNLLNK